MTAKILEQKAPSKLLLIDDDLTQHKLIELALQKDYSLIYESSGANSIATAVATRPDLILLDLQMPHVDGYEVLERIKQNPSLSNIPIFCLSAQTDEQSKERINRLGAASFLKKPIHVKTFADDIKKTLQQLNSNLHSDDRKTSVFIGLNDNEMNKWFQDRIIESVRSGRKVISLSVKNGPFYQNNEIEHFIRTGQLVFLQIKPSLIARLPYFNDLGHVVDDLLELLEDKPSEYVFIIDRPEIFLLTPPDDKKTATTLAFSHAIQNKFSEIHYLCRRPSDPKEIPTIKEMAKLLTHQF